MVNEGLALKKCAILIGLKKLDLFLENKISPRVQKFLYFVSNCSWNQTLHMLNMTQYSVSENYMESNVNMDSFYAEYQDCRKLLSFPMSGYQNWFTNLYPEWRGWKSPH